MRTIFKYSLPLIGLLLISPLSPEALNARSTPLSDQVKGEVIGQVNGKSVSLPLLKSDIKADIQGDVATVQIQQTFFNSTTSPMNATYLFPLNKDAAVFAMSMKIGDETVQAIIQEKAKAKLLFETAKQNGKAAALLTQHRPNMFTQDIANLMPGRPVQITLRYVQRIKKIDSAYELVVPLIVGPRYEGPLPKETQQLVSLTPPLDDDLKKAPSERAEHAEHSEQMRLTKKSKQVEQHGNWFVDKLPSYPPVAGFHLPKTATKERVSLSVNLKAGLPISGLYSPSHELAIEGTKDHKTLSFKKGHVIDNRDLIIRYSLEGETLQAGSLFHHDERGGFLSLLIEPPKLPQKETITARELVFVLDTSGSMRGTPMAASKRFMQSALTALRPKDYFRIIEFSNTARHFSQQAIPANIQNIKTAQNYIHSLNAGGGTEIANAIQSAFATHQPQNTMRIVVFLSDGYIGAEHHVLSTIRSQIGNARIYAFGIGTSVNRYLLDAMASEGRGYARYVDPTEKANDVADQLARELKSPLLTDISIDWNGLSVEGQSPAHIPDLFEGGSLQIYARTKNLGPHTIFINGRINGRKASLPLKLNLKKSKAESEHSKNGPLPLMWARRTIADKNRAYALQLKDHAKVRQEITQLGLRYSLQTRFTSFVAVSKQIVNEEGPALTNKPVPLPKVAGVSRFAYPKTSQFSGSSAPEPEGILGLVLMLSLLLFKFKNRVVSLILRRKHS